MPDLIEQLDAIDTRLMEVCERQADLARQAKALSSDNLDDILAMLADDSEAPLPDIGESSRRNAVEICTLHGARAVLLVERISTETAAERQQRIEAARPLWRESVKQLARALVAVGHAAAAEKAARSALPGAPAPLAHQDWYELKGDGYSGIRCWLRNLVERGFLTAGEVRDLRMSSPADALARR